MKINHKIVIICLAITLSGCATVGGATRLGVSVFDKKITVRVLDVQNWGPFDLITISAEGYNFTIPRLILGSLQPKTGDCIQGRAHLYYTPTGTNDIEAMGKFTNLTIVPCNSHRPVENKD